MRARQFTSSCCTDHLQTLFVKSKRSLSGATREPFWSDSVPNTVRKAKFNTWVPVWLFITRRLRDVSRCNDTSSPSQSIPSTVPICSIYPPLICTFFTENSTFCRKKTILSIALHEMLQGWLFLPTSHVTLKTKAGITSGRWKKFIVLCHMVIMASLSSTIETLGSMVRIPLITWMYVWISFVSVLSSVCTGLANRLIPCPAVQEPYQISKKESQFQKLTLNGNRLQGLIHKNLRFVVTLFKVDKLYTMRLSVTQLKIVQLVWQEGHMLLTWCI